MSGMHYGIIRAKLEKRGMRHMACKPISQKLFMWVVLCMGLSWSGCLASPMPLATLPLAHPNATQANLAGIDYYQQGAWGPALEKFHEALKADEHFPEAHFNAALTLHQLQRHEEAISYFRRAGELAPENETIVGSSVYRNHLGLSSTFERHLSGGYRYHSWTKP